MMTKSTLLHLRIPFSFYLMPVFFLAIAVAEVEILQWEILQVFFILHLLLYPASNGYNSYFDKDEGPIGGLKKPPKVEKQLYRLALWLDIIAIVWSVILSLDFAMMILVYGLVSKAYSHPLIRLKKYPVASWLTIGVFQGLFTAWMIWVGIGAGNINLIQESIYWQAGSLAMVLLLGSYPMTQIYQHDEDQKRGDLTLSLLLGVKGTFHFTALFFLFAMAGFFLFFKMYFGLQYAVIFIVTLTPVLLFFCWWYLGILKGTQQVSYQRTMQLNLISSICLSGFFLGMILFS